MSSPVRELDRALAGEGRSHSDETDALVALGKQINEAYATFTPPHTPQRAMFVRAVTDNSGMRPSRFLVPVALQSVLLMGVLFLGRSAMPGGTFYPVREVLRTVGLAPASTEELQELLNLADDLLDEAEEVGAENPEAAERHAFEAVRVIGMAEAVYDELEVQERRGYNDDIARLVARAKLILTEAPGEDADENVDAKPVQSQPGSSIPGNNGPNSSNNGTGDRPASARKQSGSGSAQDPSPTATAADKRRNDRANDNPSDDDTRAERRRNDEVRADHETDTKDSDDDEGDIDLDPDDEDDDEEEKEKDKDAPLDILKGKNEPEVRPSNRPRG